MTVVLAIDPGWGGTGWCLAAPSGPFTVGHVVLPGKGSRTRYSRLVKWLDELAALAGPIAADVRVRVVLEEAPEVYGGRGNQSATGYGMGTLAGAVLLWATRLALQEPESYDWPWPVPVRDWRSWWNIMGSRDVSKRAALQTVSTHRWGAFLQPWEPSRTETSHAAIDRMHARRGDVAEAMLLGVGAAMRPELAPKGPRR